MLWFCTVPPPPPPPPPPRGIRAGEERGGVRRSSRACRLGRGAEVMGVGEGVRSRLRDRIGGECALLGSVVGS